MQTGNTSLPSFLASPVCDFANSLLPWTLILRILTIIFHLSTRNYDLPGSRTNLFTVVHTSRSLFQIYSTNHSCETILLLLMVSHSVTKNGENAAWPSYLLWSNSCPCIPSMRSLPETMGSLIVHFAWLLVNSVLNAVPHLWKIQLMQIQEEKRYLLQPRFSSIPSAAGNCLIDLGDNTPAMFYCQPLDTSIVPSELEFWWHMLQP